MTVQSQGVNLPTIGTTEKQEYPVKVETQEKVEFNVIDFSYANQFTAHDKTMT